MSVKKNWLIRTKDQSILGPISKEKLEQLIKNNSLALNDEVCSGNGHWFSISEADLVKRYVFDGVKQGFNPILDTKSIYNEIFDQDEFSIENKEEPRTKIIDENNDGEDAKFPSADDLSYPGEDLPESPIGDKKSSLYDDLKKENQFVERRNENSSAGDYTLQYSLKDRDSLLDDLPKSKLPNTIDEKDLTRGGAQEEIQDNLNEIEAIQKEELEEERLQEEVTEVQDNFFDEGSLAEINIEKIELEKKKERKRKGLKNFAIILSLLLIIFSIVGFILYRIFIPNAHAELQSTNKVNISYQKKKLIFDDELAYDWGRISLKKHLMGATLNSTIDEEKFNCNYLVDNSFLIGILIYQRSHHDFLESSLYKKMLNCQELYLNSEFFASLNFYKYRTKKNFKVRSFIKKFLTNKKRISKIDSIIQKKIKVNSKLPTNDYLLSLIKILKKEIDCYKDFAICDELLKKGREGSLFFQKRIVEVFFGTIAQNRSWTRLAISELISVPHESIIFDITPEVSFHYYQKRMSYGANFFSFFNEIYQMMKDDILYKMALNYFYPYLQEIDFDRVKIGLNSSISSSEIDAYSKHLFFNQDMDYFWYFYFSHGQQDMKASAVINRLISNKDGVLFTDLINRSDFLESDRVIKKKKYMSENYFNYLMLLTEKEEADYLIGLHKVLESGLGADYIIFQLLGHKRINNDLFWWTLLID